VDTQLRLRMREGGGAGIYNGGVDGILQKLKRKRRGKQASKLDMEDKLKIYSVQKDEWR
jgi:hypothetical protein